MVEYVFFKKLTRIHFPEYTSRVFVYQKAQELSSE